ncbi:hypothetical protein HAHE_23260 [Haloferula helveola]|uniref:FAS1 domain-containing protein n=1 Tax=Haloferula helveola TaxID=490095 RepID=A0ABN6H5K9_9BACT|nr:hypothetical protein HAHE_23260 [Haloferula helveola]
MMKTRNTLLTLALATAIPAALADEKPSENTTGNPAQSTGPATEKVETPNPTDQPTGAREVRKGGAPGKSVYQTKRDTVDADGTIAEALRDAENFTILKKAIEAAGLEDTLDSEGPFTVFAPTDEAFEKIPTETLDEWLKPENKEQLRAVLLGHVATGELNSNAISAGQVTSANSDKLTLTVGDGKVMVNEAMVTKTDIDVSNGVIHAIDTVIIPEEE